MTSTICPSRSPSILRTRTLTSTRRRLAWPYLLIQRQFEDEDSGVCYIETHESDTYAGHFRLHLVELTTTRLLFEIDRPAHRTVEVTFALDPRRFSEVERILRIIFGAKR
jgi:hypothetical protein